MSRNGEGNFDIDLSAEILLKIVIELIDTVRACIDPANEDHLFCGETELMPAIDILVTLGRAYPAILYYRLSEQPIAEWKEKYLRIFEEGSEAPMENKDQSHRRAVIAETFSNLEEVVIKFRQDGLGYE